MIRDIKKLLGNQKTKRLLVVYPHPDDESVASGGILVVAKKLGWETSVICLTKGGEGRLHIHPKGKTIKEVRETELVVACERLRVDNLILGNFSDSNLRSTTGTWVGWLSDEIKKFKPSVVATYDYSGLYGHPDHIVVSLEVGKIIKRKRTKPVLLWSGLDERILKMIVKDHDVLRFRAKPNYKLPLTWSVLAKKARAIAAHKSQNLLKSKAILFYLLFGRVEWYHKVDLTRDYKYSYFDNEYSELVVNSDR